MSCLCRTLVLAVSGLTVFAAAAAGSAPVTGEKLRAGSCAVSIDARGMAGALECSEGDGLPAMDGVAELRYGAARWALTQPSLIRRTSDAVNVEYELPSAPKIHVRIAYRLQTRGKEVVLARDAAVWANGRLAEDLTVCLPNWPGKLPADAWLPLFSARRASWAPRRPATIFKVRCPRITPRCPFRW